MSQITCMRCKRTDEQLPAPPLPTDLGARIYDGVCRTCWQDWLKEQTALINHHGLNLLDVKAKQFLTQKTEEFFFGENPD